MSVAFHKSVSFASLWGNMIFIMYPILLGQSFLDGGFNLSQKKKKKWLVDFDTAKVCMVS